jgi:hypothetical protein
MSSSALNLGTVPIFVSAKMGLSLLPTASNSDIFAPFVFFFWQKIIDPPPNPGKNDILTPKMTPNYNRIKTQLRAVSELLAGQGAKVAEW